MKKRAILVSVLLATILLVLWLWPSWNGNEQKDPKSKVSPQVGRKPGAVAGGDNSRGAPPNDGQKPLSIEFTFAPEYVWDDKREIASEESRPFQLIGLGSGSARVVNSAGKVLIGSSQTQEVVDLHVSPDGSRFVVSLGDGRAQVYDSRKGKMIDLPASPDDPRLLGFGAWKWISNDALLTTSGMEALDAQGNPVKCCLGHNVSASILYAFRISDESLIAVEKPAFISSPVFSLDRVSSDGRLEFIANGNHLSPEARIGWAQPTLK